MDDVFAMRKRSPHAPTMGGLRGLTDDVISPHPRWYQPLSHGATRRDSSPFRGAEGWAEVCGVYASAYHDADTVVFLSPVRGGVLDAPQSRDCRGALGAPARHDRPHPRHPRCARLCPPPSVSNPAGAARAPFYTGVRGCPSSQAGRAWKPSPTVHWGCVSVQTASSSVRRKGRRGRRPLRVGVRRRSRHTT